MKTASKTFVCIFFCLYFISCGVNHVDPLPPCSTAYICLKIREINSAGTCCNNTTKTVISNENPSRNIWAVIYEDTLLYNEWLSNKSFLKKIPANSTSEIGCGFGLVSIGGDPQCKRYKRWRIYQACFEDDKRCAFEIPDNTDLKLQNCLKCKTCNEFSYSSLSSSQKDAVGNLYRDLVASGFQTRLNTSDLIRAFFPSPSTNSERQTIISNSKFESTGDSYHLQPQLAIPISVGTNGETYQKMWIDCPNVLSGTIQRVTNEIHVDFLTTEPAFINVQLQLEPSMKIRHDIIKHIYLLQNERKIIISGDIVCLSIKGINVE